MDLLYEALNACSWCRYFMNGRRHKFFILMAQLYLAPWESDSPGMIYLLQLSSSFYCSLAINQMTRWKKGKLKLSRLSWKFLVSLSSISTEADNKFCSWKFTLKTFAHKTRNELPSGGTKSVRRWGPGIRIFYPSSVLRRQQILRSLNLFFYHQGNPWRIWLLFCREGFFRSFFFANAHRGRGNFSIFSWI